MGEGQVIQGITGGILAIVGILLAIISSGIWFRRVKIRIGFLGIGLALSGVGLFILITSFSQYAIGFSVLATLALAFAAFLTIKEADAREERHRQEELAKEKRDKDERLLNEIIDWALEAAKSAIFRQTRMPRDLWKVKLQYKFSRTHSKYIERIISLSFSDLSSSFNDTVGKLDNVVEATQKFLEGNVTAEELRNCELQLAESVEKIVEEAAKIKTEGIG